MYVQVNTSNGIQNTDSLERWAFDYLNNHLSRFGQDISAIAVQLSDENHGAKAGSGDRRCTMEARLNGHPPIAVKHFAPNQDLAFRGAAEKLLHALNHTLGKLDRHEHRVRHTIRKDVEVAVPGEAQEAAAPSQIAQGEPTERESVERATAEEEMTQPIEGKAVASDTPPARVQGRRAA